MGDFNVDATLFKGEDEVEVFDEFEGNNDMTTMLNAAKLAFDRGSADKIVFYIYRDGELMDMKTVKAAAFDVKDTAVEINSIKESYYAN